ncbi:MAG: MBL fold metallo-hydrolase, partial [Acidobacteriota bacterium]
MLLRQIFDPKLAQYAYLIGCQRSGEALVIDPERDVDRYIELARREGLRLVAVAETHIHADFLSGARELAEALGVRLYLSDEGDADWKYEWAVGGGGGYDVRLLRDGDTFEIGKIEIRALHTPGHTPEHLSFVITDSGGGAEEPIGVVTGDFVFVGDVGRPDLLESAAGVAGQMDPSARTLHRSLDRFLDLPDYVQVWPGHGAGSACGKALGAVPSSTVGYEKRHNAAIDTARLGEDAFVEAILGGQPEPPLYFATMKRLNKEGPPVLGGLPRAEALDVDALRSRLDDPETVVVDTRTDRRAFTDGHLGGALYAPFDRSFPTIVGSYVRPQQRIALVIDAAQVDEAIRGLVRIGFDRVGDFATPDLLAAPALADRLRSTPVIDFARAERERARPGVTVL